MNPQNIASPPETQTILTSQRLHSPVQEPKLGNIGPQNVASPPETQSQLEAPATPRVINTSLTAAAASRSSAEETTSMGPKYIANTPSTQSKPKIHQDPEVEHMVQGEAATSTIISANTPDHDPHTIASPPATQSLARVHVNPRLDRMLQAAEAAATASQIAPTTESSERQCDMPQESPGTRFKRLLRSYQTDYESHNVAIFCKGMRFETSVDVLGVHSSYLRNTIPQDGRVLQNLNWDHLELFALERFMDFIYSFDYDTPTTRYNTLAADEPASNAYVHVVMHKLAEQWVMPTLSRRAKRKFDDYLTSVVQMTDVNELLDVVPLLYDNAGRRPGLVALQDSLGAAWKKLSEEQISSMDQDRLHRLKEFVDMMLPDSSPSATPTAPRKRKRVLECHSSRSPASSKSLKK